MRFGFDLVLHVAELLLPLAAVSSTLWILGRLEHCSLARLEAKYGHPPSKEDGDEK